MHVLQKELLLTLMGHYLTGDSCYYTVEREHSEALCTLSYGRFKDINLPAIKCDSEFFMYLEEHPYPVRFKELAGSIVDEPAINMLSDYYSVLSPLQLKKNIVGVVFLGNKISSQDYSESDYALLHQFCTLAAMTFNHATLYNNARLSIEELHKLNEIRTDIINRITHEFRTPLTVIKAGLASLKLDDESEQVALWINKSLYRLEHLIISLLDLNDNYSDDSISNIAEWDPVSILHEILPKHSVTAACKNISIQIMEMQKSQLPQLTITSKKFCQVVDNLLDNAIKYSNEGSNILIEFEDVTRSPDESRDGILLPDWKDQYKKSVAEYKNMANISDNKDAIGSALPNQQSTNEDTGESSRRYAVMKVTDGGIGIPIDEIKHLSQPFLQASNSPDVGVKGKGLGLTITHKILSSCGGKIYCRSEEGKGTTFTVFLLTR